MKHPNCANKQEQSAVQICPLCNHASAFFQNPDGISYFHCSECTSVFMDINRRLDSEDELKRYRLHNNDVTDPGYRRFVQPVTSHVLSNYTPAHAGLDFGSGPSSAISCILKENNYPIHQYDPFFFPETMLLSQTFDYIVCCEVMEHFYRPRTEFKNLFNMLEPGGQLICMTDLFQESVKFKSWYYRNDPTHVFFYTAHTISWIKETLGFSDVETENRLIIFTK